MKIVKMTTIRAVVTKMSAASTTSLVAGLCTLERVAESCLQDQNIVIHSYMLTILTRENPTPPRNPP